MIQHSSASRHTRRPGFQSTDFACYHEVLWDPGVSGKLPMMRRELTATLTASTRTFTGSHRTSCDTGTTIAILLHDDYTKVVLQLIFPLLLVLWAPAHSPAWLPQHPQCQLPSSALRQQPDFSTSHCNKINKTSQPNSGKVQCGEV